jgi:N-acyl-D-amino-acid deacylase
MRLRIWRASLLLLVIAAGAQTPGTVFVGASVADGSGRPLVVQNVRVVGDHIDKIGSFPPVEGDFLIDGEGLVLAPGFIDMHNHSTAGLDSDPAAESQVSQGITTVLLGQDGSSPFPVADWLKLRRSKPAAVNVITLAGHATIRQKVMGSNYQRAASPAEIARMCQLLDIELSNGAVGLSSGLEYEVGSYSKTEELIAMAKVVARHGGIYVTHMRDEGDLAFDAVREAISIGAVAGIPVQISHIKLGTASVWNRASELIRIVEQGRQRGVDITADWYPYDAWSSTIKVLVPDKQYESRISVRKGIENVGGAQNVTITNCPAHRDYEFRTLAEIAAEKNKTPVEVFQQIVNDGGANVVVKAMIESDMQTFFRQPWVMVGSDGGIGMRHPRGAGTYPRILGEYVRERNWLSLQEAIRKMTSFPADRLRLTDRGRIAVGKKADLVLLDPAKVADRATFQKPHTLSTGIRKVMVNGVFVWDEGKPTGALGGLALP